MNYKNDIESFLNDAKNKFLTKSYNKDLEGLKNKVSDYKNFLLYIENFKVSTEEDNIDEIRSYFYSEVKKVYEWFFE